MNHAAPARCLSLTSTDGAQRIGHFGFFRQQFEATLWPRVTAIFQTFNTAGATA
jgi:predicted alpha/beta hydrolase